MRRALTAAAVAIALGGGAAAADAIPYKVFWSFPNDDETAIDVDEPDLTHSNWDSELWKIGRAHV